MQDNYASHSLIASVNYAVDRLGLYRAELARVLGLMCHNVSDSMQLESLLADNKECQHRAERFVLLHDSLDNRFAGDNVAMTHWLRRFNPELGTEPMLALVDEGRLEDIINLLNTSIQSIDFNAE